ncbi:MAG: hypothetical protein ACI4KM_11135, partial [Oscillospiraceae bacterium]
MKDIRISSEIPQRDGLQTSGLITPMSTPMQPDEGFAESVGERYSTRVYDLWKRLNLVFLEEDTQEQNAPSKPPVIVNNFTSQLILQLFGGKHINRLISNDRSNSVLLSAVRGAAGASNNTAATLVKYISEKSIINKEITDFFEIYFTEKAEQTGIRVLNTVLDRILAECAERTERLTDSREILEKLAAVYHKVYKESSTDISEEILQTITAEKSAAELQIRVLREKIGERVSEEAGKAALEFIRSGKSHKEILKELTTASRHELLTQSRFAENSVEQRVLELLEKTSYQAMSQPESYDNGESAENSINPAGGNFTAALSHIYKGKSKSEIISILRRELPEKRVISAKTLENDRVVEIAAEIAGFLAGASETSVEISRHSGDITNISADKITVVSSQNPTVISSEPIDASLTEVTYSDSHRELVYNTNENTVEQNGTTYPRATAATINSQALAAQMYSGLQSRVSRYIKDKLVFEQRVSMTALPTVLSSDKEYSAFVKLLGAQSETSGKGISAMYSSSVLNRISDNSVVNSAEISLREALSQASADGANAVILNAANNAGLNTDASVFNSQNIQNVTNITNSQSGTVLPANVQNIANNTADIAYTQNLTENAQSVTNVTNSQSGTVLPANVQNIANSNTDIAYTQNLTEDTQNTQNVTNVTNSQSGTVLPANVQNIANSNADIAYTQNLTENTQNAQNVTNVTNSQSGTVLPANVQNIANDSADIAYTQNLTEDTHVTNSQSGTVLPANVQNIA